jgi:hypothetical protein
LGRVLDPPQNFFISKRAASVELEVLFSASQPQPPLS